MYSITNNYNAVQTKHTQKTKFYLHATFCLSGLSQATNGGIVLTCEKLHLHYLLKKVLTDEMSHGDITLFNSSHSNTILYMYMFFQSEGL